MRDLALELRRQREDRLREQYLDVEDAVVKRAPEMFRPAIEPDEAA